MSSATGAFWPGQHAGHRRGQAWLPLFCGECEPCDPPLSPVHEGSTAVGLNAPSVLQFSNSIYLLIQFHPFKCCHLCLLL